MKVLKQLVKTFYRLEHHLKTGIGRVYSNIVVLVIWASTTFLNKFYITERDNQWHLYMVALSFCLVFYSLKEYYKYRTKVSLILLFIFAAEMLATLAGWNLKTNYFTEIILSLAFLGIFLFLRYIWQQRSNS